MPQLRHYNVFISHAWKYRDAYHRLVDLLDGAPNFQWRNYSVPEHDPLEGGSTAALREQLRKQMTFAHLVVVIAGVYATHSGWMKAELRLADKFDKPVISIAPWGSERISTAIQDVSAETVNWSTSSIVGAIRRNAL